jgi:hypothetical protein
MQVKRLFKILIACALSMGLWTTAYAGTYTGLIKPYWYSNVLYILVPVNASCSTRNLVRLVETDPNDPVFKAKYAMLLASWIAQRPVTLTGSGVCTGEGDEWITAVNPG